MNRAAYKELLRKMADGGEVTAQEPVDTTPSVLPGTAGMFVQPSELEEVTPEADRVDYKVLLENLKRSIPVDVASTPGYVADIVNLPSSAGKYLNALFRNRPEDAAAVEFFPRGTQSSELAEQAVNEFYGSPAPEFPNVQTEVATRGAQIVADPFAALGGVKYLGALGRGIKDVFTPTSAEDLAAMQRLGITADSASTASMLGKRQETGFYSGLETAARDLPQQKGSGQQMLAMIQKQGGVKPEEIEWTGLGDFLRDKPSVTKGEIEDYLLNNRVELQEVRLGEVPGSAGPTRYHEGAVSNIHTELPGGTNYREVLLTLPESSTMKGGWGTIDDEGSIVSRFNSEAEAKKSALENGLTYDKVQPSAGSVYRSSHYIDQPNILAHVRLNDRIDTDGKKVLFIEEIQSDWHQAGRKKGYKGRTPETITEDQWYNARDKAKDALKNEGLLGFDSAGEALSVIRHYDDYASRWDIRNPESIAALDEYLRITDRYLAESSAVPDAPFKTSWHELALRRVLQEAAEGGYDRIAFTKGAMQADRYNLRKSIEEIHLSGSNLTAYDKQGRAVIRQTGVKEADLPDLIGKEATEKLLNQPKQGTLRSLVGQELEVGGEGMKGFYDQILPKSLNKLGKKFDAKVGTTRIGVDPAGLGEARYHVEHPTNPAKSSTFFDEQAARKFAEEVGGTVQVEDKTREVWSMDITPKMRETVQQTGLPLFANGGEVTQFIRKRAEGSPPEGEEVDPESVGEARDMPTMPPAVKMYLGDLLFGWGENRGMLEEDLSQEQRDWFINRALEAKALEEQRTGQPVTELKFSKWDQPESNDQIGGFFSQDPDYQNKFSPAYQLRNYLGDTNVSFLPDGSIVTRNETYDFSPEYDKKSLTEWIKDQGFMGALGKLGAEYGTREDSGKAVKRDIKWR